MTSSPEIKRAVPLPEKCPQEPSSGTSFSEKYCKANRCPPGRFPFKLLHHGLYVRARLLVPFLIPFDHALLKDDLVLIRCKIKRV